MMHPAQDYILGFEGEQQKLLQYFYDFLSSFPEIRVVMKWNIPVYIRKKQICYVNPLKNGGVELCFNRGHFISDENNLLQKKGRKQIEGITFQKIAEIDEEILYEIVQEAILLDDRKWKTKDGKLTILD